jgi:hypothetical protein
MLLATLRNPKQVVPATSNVPANTSRWEPYPHDSAVTPPPSPPGGAELGTAPGTLRMWLKSRGIEPTSLEGFTLAQIGGGDDGWTGSPDSGSMASAFRHRIQDF